MCVWCFARVRSLCIMCMTGVHCARALPYFCRERWRARIYSVVKHSSEWHSSCSASRTTRQTPTRCVRTFQHLISIHCKYTCTLLVRLMCLARAHCGCLVLLFYRRARRRWRRGAGAHYSHVTSALYTSAWPRSCCTVTSPRTELKVSHAIILLL